MLVISIDVLWIAVGERQVQKRMVGDGRVDARTKKNDCCTKSVCRWLYTNGQVSIDSDHEKLSF